MAERVSFHPTKKLFIDVLTRDISIRDCIFDLFDNSVDSYIRHQVNEKREVQLSFNKDVFEVTDNCGGISKKQLTEQVFRFGAVELASKAATIGVYGIGLKRSIFKLGKYVVFETDDGDDYCRLDIDVDKWMEDDKTWDLDLTDTSGSRLNGNKPYTKIKITDLRAETKEAFTPEFESDLKDAVTIYYSRFIQDGQIDFYVSDRKMGGFEITIRASDDYKPVKYEGGYDSVQIQIICWLDIPEKARTPKEMGKRGWNVYMNKRLVIFDDTSPDTGWIGERPYLPKFHSIYNDFRGIVFLSTDDPLKLPINTSKNGFNKDNRIYQHLLLKMCEIARPIISYLGDKYERQKSTMDAAEDKALEYIEQDKQRTKNVDTWDIKNAPFAAKFEPPVSKELQRKRTTSIQYSKPKDRVEKVKRILGVRSNTEVGTETFEYFWDSEGLDEIK